ncbi:MAG: DUF2156 domain-containing protein [Desulfobacterales bacterium]|nr:DUF2156 domain-containing protein [Desulfobacterales bacterium]
MKLNFEAIDLHRQSDYLTFFNACPQKASEYSFINLWGWAEKYGLYWAWTEELVIIKQTLPEIVYWAPVGPWEEIDWKAFFKKHIEQGTKFVRVPEDLLSLWKNSIEHDLKIDETRGHWDYIYSVPELVELRGKRFHKKRNLLNKFEKSYEYKYIPLSPDMIDMALAMQQDWCTWRDCESSESLSAENDAISRVLNCEGKLENITGGAILVENNMVGYTVAENVTDDTVVIHFEKGDPDYKGVYQAINQMFLKNMDEKITTVNREQDLNDEGLRKAKMSYNPVDFIKKYSVTVQ